MGKPAAKLGDRIQATDIHIVMVVAGPSTVPTPMPSPFSGLINGGVSTNVMVDGKPAAILQCSATNVPPHIPSGGAFQNPPTNRATVITGSATVLINNKPAVRAGDTALTCNDPSPLPIGKVIAVGTVLIGG